MTAKQQAACEQALIDLDAGTITKPEALRIFIEAGSDPDDAADIIAGESDCVEE